MRLRTFTAPDIHAAMAQVRKTLGDDAVIISTTRDPVGKNVTITAAAERDDPMHGMPDLETPLTNGYAAAPIADTMPSPSIEESRVLVELKALLNYHSVPANVEKKLLDTAQMVDFYPDASVEGLRKTLATLLEASFQFLPLPLNRIGYRVMLVGQPGIGKTMTIAKMAAQLVMEKKSVIVITTDTKRAGGVEQLQAYTDVLGLVLRVAEDRAMLKQLLEEANPDSRILIDSAGTNPYDTAELKELSQFLGLSKVEPVFVMPAGGNTDEAAHCATAFGFTGARRMLITRTDVSRRFGSILAAAHAGGYAFCNSSSSSKVVGEYRAADADFFSHLLMQYRLNQ
jgi:flagellar biosynthesis protein FlhF